MNRNKSGSQWMVADVECLYKKISKKREYEGDDMCIEYFQEKEYENENNKRTFKTTFLSVAILYQWCLRHSRFEHRHHVTLIRCGGWR